MENQIKTIARFLSWQGTQITDSNNQIMVDDLILKDGTILRFDKNGYLDGEIEYQDCIENWRNGRLHGNPAIVNVARGIEEDWDNGKLIKVRHIEE